MISIKVRAYCLRTPSLASAAGAVAETWQMCLTSSHQARAKSLSIEISRLNCRALRGGRRSFAAKVSMSARRDTRTVRCWHSALMRILVCSVGSVMMIVERCEDLLAPHEPRRLAMTDPLGHLR